MLDSNLIINSKARYEEYKKADVIAYSVYPTKKGIFRALLFNRCFRFSRVLRRYEYLINCKSGIFGKIEKLFVTMYFRHLSVKLCYTVPPNVLAPGCCLHAYGPIVINKGASVGENTRIHVGVHLGTGAGYANAAPKIGANCYLGPGVKMFGDITICEGTAVGANAVVNKSCDKPNVLLVGIPAAVKKEGIDSLEYIVPATLVAKLNQKEQIELYHKPSLVVRQYLQEKGYLPKL